MNDRHEHGAPTSDPYRALELTQLVDDLSRTGLAVLHKRDGLAVVAEALYERGVRSRLFAPYRDGELVQFTWDPSFEGFEVTETGVYELVMEAIDVPDIEPWPTFPRTEMPRMLHRLRRKAGLRPVLTQMSEVPGHVTRQVPGPIPERQLPQGVYNVIHFVQLLDLGAAGAGNKSWSTGITDGRGGERRITTADLHAVLAEIPDVAPRYPTIWAYEQACRTIREQGRRIEDALTVLEQRPPDPEDCIKVIRDAHETLKLRMPRVLPATPEQLSEVARAFELVQEADPGVSLEGWAAAATTLRDEALRLAGQLGERDVVVLDESGQPVPCGSCSALEPTVSKPAVGRSGRGWPRCATHLVEDALDDAGLEKDVKRCSSCSHLASSHYEDGSGCSVTIRDHGISADAHCPCTFDARSVHHG